MICENVYQSEICCEFSEVSTVGPCQNFTNPHSHINGWPMTCKITANAMMIKTLMNRVVRIGICRKFTCILFSKIFTGQPGFLITVYGIGQKYDEKTSLGLSFVFPRLPNQT